MPVKIKSCDTWFSKCIRESNNWTCERCRTKYERGSQGLHCSHIFSRRHRTIRWCKDNAQALCFSCHQWFGGNPADSGAWLVETLGEGYIDLLREKKNSKVRVPKKEEKEISKHYRLQLKLLEDGAADFISWQ